jgi:hypothetical protein
MGPGTHYLTHPALNHMLTCLQGPVKLGVPDDREPDYTRYFVQAPVSELTTTHPVPDQLTVPANLTTDLTILVDFASTVSAPLSLSALPSFADVFLYPRRKAAQSSRGVYLGGKSDLCRSDLMSISDSR